MIVNKYENIEIYTDEIAYKNMETSFSPGKTHLHAIFSGVSVRTEHAKRNIMMGKAYFIN